MLHTLHVRCSVGASSYSHWLFKGMGQGVASIQENLSRVAIFEGNIGGVRLGYDIVVRKKGQGLERKVEKTYARQTSSEWKIYRS